VNPTEQLKVLGLELVDLTERRQVAVLGAEQEQVYRHLLAGAVQRQLLVEVRRRRQVLHVLRRKRTTFIFQILYRVLRKSTTQKENTEKEHERRLLYKICVG